MSGPLLHEQGVTGSYRELPVTQDRPVKFSGVIDVIRWRGSGGVSAGSRHTNSSMGRDPYVGRAASFSGGNQAQAGGLKSGRRVAT